MEHVQNIQMVTFVFVKQDGQASIAIGKTIFEFKISPLETKWHYYQNSMPSGSQFMNLNQLFFRSIFRCVPYWECPEKTVACVNPNECRCTTPGLVDPKGICGHNLLNGNL